MAPLDKTVFIDPLDVSSFVGQPSDTSPGFTKDVIDTLGNLGDSTDGFDELVAGAGQLIDAWDAATAAQDADLDAILALHDTTNPAPLDNSLAGYVDSFATGKEIVATGEALSTPGLLELPINPYFNQGVTATPVQDTLDLGTRHVGDPAVEYVLGIEIPSPWGNYGLFGVQLANGDPDIFSIKRQPGTKQHFAFFALHWDAIPVTDSVVISFTKPGKFTGQVNYAGSAANTFTIKTYTVTIEP